VRETNAEPGAADGLVGAPSAPSAVPGRGTPETDVVLRLMTGLGALGLVWSLWRQWAFDRAAEPDIPLNAWAYFAGWDMVLALLAVVAGAGAARPRREWALAAFAAAAAALLITTGMLVTTNLGIGLKLALLASLVTVAGAAGRIAPAGLKLPAERRLARVTATPAVARGLSATRTALVSSTFLATVIALLTFPLFNIGPALGTDGAWQAALHMAAAQDLHFGSDVVFTYGPLGYLTLPMLYYAGTGQQAFLYVVVVQVAFAVLVLVVARRSLPLRWALALTFLMCTATRVSAFNELTSTVLVAGGALIVAIGLMLRWERRGVAPGLPTAAAFGALAALQLLIKLNSGLTVAMCGAIALLMAGNSGRWSRVGVFAGSLAGTLLVLWGLLGQRLEDLWPYFRYSYEIVKGFGEAMSAAEPGRQWEYLAAVIVTGAVLWTAWDFSRGWSGVGRAGLMVLVAVFSFSWFKQGFTRHDGAHSPQFFISLAIAAVACLSRVRPEPALATVALACVAMLGAENPAPHLAFPVRTSVKTFWSDAKTVRDADAFIATTRVAHRQQNVLDARTLDLLRGRTTHIYPLDASVAWIYPEIRWRPLPLIQSYVAYTAALQRLDAAFLRTPRAPERILRVPGFGPFDDPAAGLEMLCRYRDVHSTAAFEVLGRVPNRCGTPRLIGSEQSTTLGAPVPIPDPPSSNEIVVGRLHGLGIAGRERVYSLLYRAYDREVVLARDEQRVIPDHGSLPSLLKVPVLRDYPGTWGLNEPGSTLQFKISQTDPFNFDQSLVDSAYRIDYYAIPLVR
jgi:hypothetical protein